MNQTHTAAGAIVRALWADLTAREGIRQQLAATSPATLTGLQARWTAVVADLLAGTGDDWHALYVAQRDENARLRRLLALNAALAPRTAPGGEETP